MSKDDRCRASQPTVLDAADLDAATLAYEQGRAAAKADAATLPPPPPPPPGPWYGGNVTPLPPEYAPRRGGRVAKQRAQTEPRSASAPPDWPPPRAVEAQASAPTPGTLRLDNFVIASKTKDFFEAAKNDPELQYEGSFAQFVDEVIDAYFWMLGMNIEFTKDEPRFAEVAA
jgi:hypothetical protein